MGPFIGIWIGQIVFGLLVAMFNPKRDDVSVKAQNARRSAIWAGFIPCVGFMLILQVFWLLYYRGAIRRAESVRGNFNAIPDSFGSPGRGRSAPQPDQAPKRPPSDNPFL